MRVTLFRAAVPVVLVVLAALPASSQEPPLDAGLERQVGELNTTLSQLVELLRRQLDSSNAAVLMQRVQLMTTRIAPIEVELREARDEEQDLQRELDEMELSADRFEAQVAAELERGEISAEHARSLLDQERPMFEQRRKQIEDRLWSAQQLVIDLRQRLGKRRTEIETWESEIDRALGLR